jgi:hypothetical protein
VYCFISGLKQATFLTTRTLTGSKFDVINQSTFFQQAGWYINPMLFTICCQLVLRSCGATQQQGACEEVANLSVLNKE